MDVFIINGKKCLNRQKTYEYLKSVLFLPPYFGNNLDALEDCLNEYFYKKTIIIINKDDIISNMGQYGKDILNVFEINNNLGIIKLKYQAL